MLSGRSKRPPTSARPPTAPRPRSGRPAPRDRRPRHGRATDRERGRDGRRRQRREQPGFTPEVDPDALHLCLTFRYVPAPWTLFRGIHELAAGTYLCARPAGNWRLALSRERYARAHTARIP